MARPQAARWRCLANVNAGSALIEAIIRLIPALQDVAIGVPLALIAAAVFGGAASLLRVRRRLAVPYTRKLFHIGIFTIAAGAHAVFGAPAVVAYGTTVALVVVFAVARGDGYALYEALARPSDAPHRALFVIVPMLTTALGGLGAAWLFDRFAAVGYMVAGWGDAAGEPVGTRWGRHRYRVPSMAGVEVTRSIEGSLAVFVVGTLAAVPALLLLDLAPLQVATAAIAAGAAGTIVEAISTHGLDNLTVQVVAAGAAFLVASG